MLGQFIIKDKDYDVTVHGTDIILYTEKLERRKGMNNDLEILLKKEMGYTEEVKVCQLCYYFTELNLCKYNRIRPIPVKSNGICNKFAQQRMYQ